MYRKRDAFNELWLLLRPILIFIKEHIRSVRRLLYAFGCSSSCLPTLPLSWLLRIWSREICQSLRNTVTILYSEFSMSKMEEFFLDRSVYKTEMRRKYLPNVQSDGQKADESSPQRRCTRLCPQAKGCTNNAISTEIAFFKKERKYFITEAERFRS